MPSPISAGSSPLFFGCNAVKSPYSFPRIYRRMAAHYERLWLTPGRATTAENASPQLEARIETTVPHYWNVFRKTLIGTSAIIISPILQHFVPALWSSPRADWSDIKLRQSTDNISCLSHLPARGECVCLSVWFCVCVKSLGISPSSRRPFKCMRQYHTILAGGGERCKWTIRIKKYWVVRECCYIYWSSLASVCLFVVWLKKRNGK